jgi:hypothetical protein
MKYVPMNQTTYVGIFSSDKSYSISTQILLIKRSQNEKLKLQDRSYLILTWSILDPSAIFQRKFD